MKLYQDYIEYKERSGSALKPLFNPCFYINVNFRISNALFKIKLFPIAKIFWLLNRILFAVDIDPGAKLAGGFLIVHGMGIVIGRYAETRGAVRIYQGATIGGNNFKTATFENKTIRHPIIMPGVVIGINSAIVGPIVIGTNTTVGIGAIITKNIEDNVTVVGNNTILKNN